MANFLHPRPLISIIAAAARNGTIGSNGVMPWHLPGDLRYFKRVTQGKPVIMGQKTWQSLPRRPLPGRANIVLTRQRAFAAPGAFIAHSLEEAVQIAADWAAAKNIREIFIIGGGTVFAQALPLADKIYLTQILADIDGDTFFKPSLPAHIWQKSEKAAPVLSAKDSHAYHFLLYQRRHCRRSVPKISSLWAIFGKGGRAALSLKRLFSAD
ncbi:MAG: dihydrofolate reductase [Candidatus Tokpelaia sp.]|nr:MAG: dihydrofolate reductase [Candidatus Tokpelaia sp.]KAA6206592.1 MAG: dihydrofolate reductase [Candidatus Tokpelaia sp.]